MDGTLDNAGAERPKYEYVSSKKSADSEEEKLAKNNIPLNQNKCIEKQINFRIWENNSNKWKCNETNIKMP